MNDTERCFHETWLGMAQPSEGLVVSVPVLVEAQCMAKQARDVQEALLACSASSADDGVVALDPNQAIGATALRAFAWGWGAGVGMGTGEPGAGSDCGMGMGSLERWAKGLTRGLREPKRVAQT